MSFYPQFHMTSPLAAPVTPAAGLPPEVWWLSNLPAGARFQAAWALASGAGVTIGVVDNGVNAGHADLVGRVRHDLGLDLRGTGSGNPDAGSDGHGTRVAGIISGLSDNTIGGIGATPGAMIAASHLRFGAAFQVADAASLLEAEARLDVSNNSWGLSGAFSDNFLTGSWSGVGAALALATAEGRGGLGTVFVFAGGNGRMMIGGENRGDDANFHNLTNSRHTIAVGATDATGRAAFFSSPGTSLLLSAPGMGLLSASGLAEGDTGAASVSGTSFAAPLVSSAVALMLQVNPFLGWRDVQEILALTARPSDAGQTNGATGANGGGMLFDRNMGFGLLDAEAAVRLARHWAAQSTTANERHLSADLGAMTDPDPVRQVLRTTVAMDLTLDWVELRLNVTSSHLRDLRIELISPDGTRSLIAENLAAAGARTALDFTFSSVMHWGESVSGDWRVELSHANPAASFQVLGASLEFHGDAPDPAAVWAFTPAYAALAADPARRLIANADAIADSLNFSAAGGAVAVDLRAGTARLHGHDLTLKGGFDTVIGGIGDDSLTGAAGADRLIGDDGADLLIGGMGTDYLDGGAGDDILQGGPGDDTLRGGAGHDIVRLAGTWADYTVAAQGDSVLLTHADGTDLLDGIEEILFSDGTRVRVESGAAPLANAAPQILTIAAAAEQLTLTTGPRVLARITAADANLSLGDRLTFSLDDAPEGITLVQVDGTSALLTAGPTGTGSGPVHLVIRVSDLHGASSLRHLTLAPAPPDFTPADATPELAEATPGALVTSLAVTDVALADVLVWTVDDPRFQVIVTDTGFALRLRDGVALDHEADPRLSVTVTATDPDGVTVSRSLSISVSDVNEAPTLSGLAVNAVETGLSLPARLHLPTLTDPEGGTMTLTLTAAPSEGALWLDGKPISAGQLLTPAEFAALRYLPGATPGTWPAQFTLSDGVHEVGVSLPLTVLAAANGIHRGSASGDLIDAAAGDDAVTAGHGDDTVLGGAGNDTLWGNHGRDLLIGGAGADALIGGAGFDTVSYRDAPGAVVVSLARPQDNTGDAAGDTFAGIEAVLGSAGDDRLIGNARANLLEGGGGDDWLQGGRGADTLTGGAGADSFVFANRPDALTTITDFAPGQDRIALSLSVFRALSGGLTGKTIAENHATDQGHHLIFDRDTGLLSYDADGSGAGDMVALAVLGPTITLSDQDFILI